MSIIKYTNSHSTNLQESFVISVLKEKKNGYYVELGSGKPNYVNNTYLLETILNWKGIGLDINCEANVKMYNALRKNDCFCLDAITFDYKNYFEKNNFPKQIDFLQIDLDNGPEECIPDNFAHTDYVDNITKNSSGNLLALINIPLTTYRFSIIIFEHEYMTNYKNQSIRDAQREILSSLGYKLIVDTGAEDWWVDPLAIDKENYINMYSVFNIPYIKEEKELTLKEEQNA
jgi:hypothetical protein